MTICAYCGNDRRATREHVIPSFMYSLQKQFTESVVGWNEVAGRMIKGEAKVKDVCAACNNGELGALDSYGKTLLSDCGLLVRNYKETTVSVSYDYSLLLRWLLKISFNSARTDGAHAPIFLDYIPFIMGLAPPPPRHRVACLLSLAAPELLKDHSPAPEAFINLAQGSGFVNPFLVRISYGGIAKERYVHRVNIFGPAIFQLLMFKDGVLPGHAASEIRSILKLKTLGVEVSAKRSVVNVSAGKMSWLDIYGPQIIRARASETARGG